MTRRVLVFTGVLALVFLWFWPRGVIPERRRRFPPVAEGEGEQPLTPIRAGR